MKKVYIQPTIEIFPIECNLPITTSPGETLNTPGLSNGSDDEEGRAPKRPFWSE